MVEASLIVCIVGVVLAVFIPTFVRELRTSKTNEAVEQLASLRRSAAAYFAARVPGEGGTELGRCLPPTAGPTPREPSPEPSELDFHDADTPGYATWRALGFRPRTPLRYAYTFEPAASGCGLRSPEGTYLLTLRAEGDLDGDGERSLFEVRMRADDTGPLVEQGILYIRDRAE